MNGKRRLLGSFTYGSMANALVEVVVSRLELSMPPSIQVNQMLGFSL